MSRAEQVFLPVYLFLMFISYLYFFLRMLPGIAAAVLLGRFSGAWVFRRSSGRRRTLAALLWDLAAAGLSAFLGFGNGWLVLYTQKGKFWGACLAAAGFLAGWLWLHLKRKKED